MRGTGLVPITVLAGLAGGCVTTSAGKTSGVESTQTGQIARNRDDVWEVVQEVLRRQGWRLDRLDREAGLMTTLPETSQHFFEVWRKDVNTRPDFWEATMTPVRRWAQVQVSTAGAGSEVLVTVHKEQLSSPDRQFNSSGAAYQYFGTSLPSTAGKKITPEDDRWVGRGRDSAMEQYIMGAIMEGFTEPPG